MARSITAAAAKIRAAKSKATKDAKRRSALEDMGLMTERKKIRKPRKAMSDEQRQAASERLAKARAAKGPAKNTMYPEELRKIPDDETFSIHNVKQWLVNQKELLSSMREYKDSKEPAERARYFATEAYVGNLDNYLRTGVYSDLFYGINGTNKVTYVSAGMAYYVDGTPKRSVGVMYPDIGLYTQEMENDDRVRISQQSKVLKDGGRYSPQKKAKLH
jgi:hypothetical protein